MGILILQFRAVGVCTEKRRAGYQAGFPTPERDRNNPKMYICYVNLN